MPKQANRAALRRWSATIMALVILSWMALAQPVSTFAAVTTLTIVNQSSTEIWYAYPRVSGSARWSTRDLLGPNIIPVGKSLTLRLTTGTYDFAAYDQYGSVIDQVEGLAVEQAQKWYVGGTVGIADEVSVNLQNAQSEALCELYLSPSTETEWGENQLGSTPLERGETWSTTIAPGEYDLKAIGCSGEVLDQAFGLDLSEGGSYVTP